MDLILILLAWLVTVYGSIMRSSTKHKTREGCWRKKLDNNISHSQPTKISNKKSSETKNSIVFPTSLYLQKDRKKCNKSIKCWTLSNPLNKNKRNLNLHWASLSSQSILSSWWRNIETQLILAKEILSNFINYLSSSLRTSLFTELLPSFTLFLNTFVSFEAIKLHLSSVCISFFYFWHFYSQNSI